MGRLESLDYEQVFATIHNHPYGGTFSILDIIQILTIENMTIEIVISNDCKHSYMIYKTASARGLIVKIIRKVIDFVIKHKIVERHANAIKIIKALEKHGFIYKEYYNA